MSNKIEKVLEVAYVPDIDAGKFLTVAVYRAHRDNLWHYNVAANPAPRPLPFKLGGLESINSVYRHLPIEFDDLNAYKSVQSDTYWHENWDDLIRDLSRYDWNVGKPIFCLPEYADQIWAEFSLWHGLIEFSWGHKIRAQEFLHGRNEVQAKINKASRLKPIQSS